MNYCTIELATVVLSQNSVSLVQWTLFHILIYSILIWPVYISAYYNFHHTSLYLSYTQQSCSLLDVQVSAQAKGWKREKKEATLASRSSRTNGRGQPALCPPRV